jgi:hypothetical protein
MKKIEIRRFYPQDFEKYKDANDVPLLNEKAKKEFSEEVIGQELLNIYLELQTKLI